MLIPMETNLIIQSLILLASVLVLAKASHMVINSAVKLAKFTGLDELVIGFIVISVTTSLPELAVSVSAISKGDVGISIGNLLGSNITDICLIVGLVALLKPVKISRWMFRDLSTILFLTSVIPLFLLVVKEASRLIGAVLLIFFALFCLYSLKSRITTRAPKPKTLNTPRNPYKKKRAVLVNSLSFLVGIGGVILSSNFAVDSALNVASIIGIVPAVIGATVVAMATSLPELSVNLAALRTKHISLALGDAIGAGLTNTTLNLGIVLLVAPITVNMTIFSTLVSFLLLANVFMWYFLERGKLTHLEGLSLLILYQLFLVTIFEVQIALLTKPLTSLP